MRTRRSNRAQSYLIEKYDFESSEAEAEPAPRRRNKAAADDDERDADFGHGAAANSDSDGGEPDAAEKDRGDVDEDAPGPELAKPAPRRSRKPSAKALIARRAATGPPSYLELEPVPSDSHAVKSYVGPYDRCFRGQSLIRAWFGPHPDAVNATQRLLDRWTAWTVLPPKVLSQGYGDDDDDEDEAVSLGEKYVWLGQAVADREAELARRWRARIGTAPFAASRILTDAAALPYRLPDRPLSVLLGPYPAQRAVTFRPGDVYCLSRHGVPLDQGDGDNTAATHKDGNGQDEDDAKVPIGWMLDTGGLVVGMDWAPREQDTRQSQLLALAVIPHADHETYDYETEHQKHGFERHGLVQLWALDGEQLGNGIVRPSTRRGPKLRRRLCFDCGRARRVRWSPAGRHLAVLCGGGGVRIVDIGDEDTDGAYEKVEEPLATLALRDEDGIKATSMAWATYSRLVVGYSDGSLALWSVHPACLLSRYPVHHSDVVDLATGAPTMPYLVASSPVGGSVKLVDVRSPGCETTEVQINAVNSQPNMLAWSDHVLGFFSAYPSANALNTMVGFVHHRHFPIVRRIFTSECFLSCLAVGRTHPYLLIGTTDGSLWSLNPQCELFKTRRPAQDRIRIFQHEHRPPGLMPRGSPAPARGASRILHGFAMEKNVHAMPDTRTPSKKTARRGKKRDDDDDEDEHEDVDGGDDAGGEPFSLMDPARGIVHEPLTRVTTVEWNPNLGFGCWAAAALGSGLVRVLDLGLEDVG